MNVTKWRFFFLLMTTMLFAVGCSQEDDTEETSQRTSIENYLRGQQYPYTEVSGVYRYVANADRADYATSPILEASGTAIIDFAVYSFATGPGQLYYTNRKELVDEEYLADLEQYWPFTSQEVSLGDSRLLKGVRIGLAGCHEGDSVQLYLVSSLGYGKKPWGVVPANTPLLWDIVVKQVVK